ncbi:MAG: hypothetical protein DLM59_02095 [Pseudonocardiales bacterium]|nr:MAG: hypothetical protein DLM59_02095 [Pseudonocardiales bacterium]
MLRLLGRPPGPWRFLVPCIALGAGVLFSTSAETSKGTDLRSGRRLQLEQLITERNASVKTLDAQRRSLRRQVDQATTAESGRDAGVATAQKQADGLRLPSGLSALEGPGLVVALDDAPRGAGGALPAGAGPDDVVVHQQDVQAVVNALWAGGADAMTIMGQRVVATSAVRCVGNTLLLQGRTYSPPFVIAAIGDPSRLRSALGAEPGVSLFREYVAAYHLGYQVETRSEVTVPAFDGSLSLSYARPGS